MSLPTKDGAWVSATCVLKLECTVCGVVSISKYPKNDRETDALMVAHAREKHGGPNRY